jgi:hypothetical protein
MFRPGIFLPPAALIFLFACGGSGGGQSPPPAPNPDPTPQNPCLTASLEADFTPPAPETPGVSERKKTTIDGDPRWRVLDALWLHREVEQARSTGSGQAPSTSSGQARSTSSGQAAPPVRAADIGEIAVVEDAGDLIAAPNALDLSGLGLRFESNGAGGYDVRRIDGAFRTTLGSRMTLSDDDSVAVGVPFGFTFYSREQTAAFVNSDGNITFEEEDKASTERNVARLLTGPPRVSPFLSDLDPSAPGGRVFVHAAGDQYTVTWCSVRAFESQRTTTVQATLLPGGAIEFKYGPVVIVPDAIVGLSPGRTASFTPVNLSDSGPTPGGSAALGERFAERPVLDTVALTRAFYQSHPDNYDQLVIWTDAALVRDAFAYEQTVANEVRGIGVPVFDLAREFGSGGRLRSMAVMDWLGKYPDDPGRKFLGENSTLSVLGQEVGHRWLAFMDFRDRTGQRSDLLLGRGLAHWSFFFDSDASVMEGNDIEDLGGGSFRTVAAVERYSLLDQYAMGLVPESAVTSFFYVENPTNQNPIRERDDGPQVGVTFNGTRRDVLIQDVIAVHGPRQPSAANSPRVHRQAFVYLVGAGRQPESGHIDKLERIRREWEIFFVRATDGRMQADTRLR